MALDQEVLSKYELTEHIGSVDINSLEVDITPSGFPGLDEILFLKKNEGELIIIGARPSMGKSAFTFQLAKNIAQKSVVQVFSLEMSKESIFRRLAAEQLDVSAYMIQTGRVPKARLEKAYKELAQMPFYIVDRGGLGVFEICEEARKFKQTHDTQLIVVDFLQRLKMPKGHSKDDEIGSITKELKNLAKELKVPVVVASQLNRSNETRGGSSGSFTPRLSDLRESGNIEQDADIVILLHREAYYRPDPANLTKADFIVAKNRNGMTKTVTMDFIQTQTKFVDGGIEL